MVDQMSTHIRALETRIADRGATTEITSNCQMRHDGTGWWFRLCAPGTDAYTSVYESATYLIARGLLKRIGDEVQFTHPIITDSNEIEP